MIFVNFKTYEQGSGERAITLTKALEEAAQEVHIKVIPVVQAPDIKNVVASTTLEVWTQKIDPIDAGGQGGISAETVLEDGATGTFLNHSDYRFSTFEELAKASDLAKEAGLKTLIFAKDMEELKNACSLSPDFVAYEPPELIGSTTTSVSEAKPEIVAKAVEISKLASIPLIIGAGIHSEKDIKTGLSLGAAGFAIATNIVKSDDPKMAVEELAKGYQ